MNLTPVPLTGLTVSLTPLTTADLPELTTVALSSPSIWEHIPYPVRTPADVAALLDMQLGLQSRGAAICFATRIAASGVMVGGTSIRMVDAHAPAVEIGGTWITPPHQRTRVNTEAKRLMLAHCFDTLGCARVELKTDERNLRSQAAIARIGAAREGVLRDHMRRTDGSLRSSVLFSMLQGEWPAAREKLDARLAALA